MYEPPRDPTEKFHNPTTPWRLYHAITAKKHADFWWVALGNTVTTAAAIGFFWYIGWFIDRTIVAGRAPTGPEIATAFLVGIIVLASHTHAIYLVDYRLARFMAWTWTNASHRLIRHTTDVGAPLTLRHKSGDVVSTTITDSHLVNSIGFALGQFSVHILSRIIGTCAVAAVINWRVGLFTLIGSAIAVALSSAVGRLNVTPSAKLRAAEAQLSALGVDTLTGIRVLRGLGATGEALTRYEHSSGQVQHRESVKSNIRGVIQGWGVLCSFLLLVAVTAYAAYEVDAGRLSIGGMVTLVSLAVGLVNAIGQVALLVASLAQGHVGLRRMLKLLAEPSLQDATGTPTRTDAIPTTAVLRDATTDITIAPGELTVLSGDQPTISDALHRIAHLNLATPTNTGATADGQPITDWPIPRIREHITLSGPRPELLSGTLRTQVDPLRQHTDDAIHAALHAAAADDVVTLLPLGLSDYVSEKGRSLSGGQQQRIALARVLLANPPVLLLIDPTSAVDAPTELAIAQRLADYRHGRTTVIATSSRLFEPYADIITHAAAPTPYEAT